MVFSTPSSAPWAQVRYRYCTIGAHLGSQGYVICPCPFGLPVSVANQIFAIRCLPAFNLPGPRPITVPTQPNLLSDLLYRTVRLRVQAYVLLTDLPEYSIG